MKILYDWDNAPVWARWAARDSNGFARWFSTKPYPRFSAGDVEWLPAKNSPCIQTSCNPFWKDRAEPGPAELSLESRPTEEQLDEAQRVQDQLELAFKQAKRSMDVTTYQAEVMYVNAMSLIYKTLRNIPIDPLTPFLGEHIVVVRPEDTVIVTILQNKIDKTYSFVNLTKNHVCTCKFNTILEAFEDLEDQFYKSKVKDWYFKVNE